MPVNVYKLGPSIEYKIQMSRILEVVSYMREAKDGDLTNGMKPQHQNPR